MKIFLAVTIYNDQIHGVCSESILKNCLSLMRAGHTVIPYYNSDLYIDRSRNLCVNVFLDSDCSDIVFIDSDLGFDDDAILKLFKHDKDIVAGAYPYKKADSEFPITLDFSRNNNCKDEETGLAYVKRAPTGFMRINRRVFNKLVSEYKLLPDERGIYSFFRTGMICENDNNWYGEDAAFCKLWTDIGGLIFVEPNINFTHAGMKQYEGNYHEYLTGRRVDKTPDNWTTDVELFKLRELASKCNDVVEVGSWKGRSTKALLESCKGNVYAVDHWKGTDTDMTMLLADYQDVYGEFFKNVGHYSNLIVLKGNSVDMADQFDGNRADMVFIDADHEECKTDIEAWMPKCNKIMCGHDYNNEFPSVMRAVDEKFDKINLCGSLWWVEL